MRTSGIAMLLALFVLAGCRAAAGPVERQVTGTVTAGPTCPVVTDPPDPSCADRPVADALLIFEDLAGHEITRVRSAGDGTFSLRLIPGSYSVIPQPVQGLLGTPGPTDLTVPPDGSIDPIAITYDTGIR